MNELIEIDQRALTRAEFQQLSDIPPDAEWFANIRNLNTRRAYKKDVLELIELLGLRSHDELRLVMRAHILFWRKDMERRELAAATIRRKLSAVSAMFDWLCENNAVPDNPVHGVRRPREGSNEGKTPALGERQARLLLGAPATDTPKGKRDRAILSVLLHHAIRRDELCKLRLKDRQSRQGVLHLVVQGKGEKLRFVPLHPHSAQAINAWLEELDPRHLEDCDAPLFRSVHKGGRVKPNALTGEAIYNLVRHYGAETGLNLDVHGLSPHAMRATAATNALEHEADIAKVQEWLGHANISTTRLYDRRKMKPEDSPTFRISY